MVKKGKKIYFVHQGFRSFVKKDLEILRKHHRVKTVNNFNATLLKIPANIVGTLWCDLVFCWFGSLRFIIPILFGRLLRKKVVIVAGGYDVVNLPEIGYGNMAGGMRAHFQKLVFKLAHQIICISESNRDEAIRNANIPAERITLIYHGFYPTERLYQDKEDIIITVGRVNVENLLRKGLKFYIEVAKFFPNIPFYLIGSLDNGIKEKLLKDLPDNVTLTGFIPDKELEQFFKKSKVYIQASLHEGFGCSVAEAMLHECIPVVSNCFALPEVVGDCGYLFQSSNLQDLRNKIQIALNDKKPVGKKARLRIVSKFSIKARTKSLLDLIDSL